MKSITIIIFLMVSVVHIFAQGVGIGTNTPAPSAILEVKSNSQGLLISRLTTSQRKAIVSPAVGLLVYDLDKNTLYMFDGFSWLPFATMGASSANPVVVPAPAGANFLGGDVAISGYYAVIGAPDEDKDGNPKGKGAVYIFKKINSSWVFMTRLTAFDRAYGDEFGAVVEMDNDRVVVGVPKKTTNNVFESGAIYIYRRVGETWNHETKLYANDPGAGDHFGTSVAIDGNLVLAGAPNDDIDAIGDNKGSVYGFVLTNFIWAFNQKITAPGALSDERMGESISLSGSWLISGANHKVYFYVWLYGGWVYKQTFTNPLPNTPGFAFFGFSVSVSGNVAVVGNASHDKDLTQLDAGAAHVYELSAGLWTLKANLIPEETMGGDFFGYSVSVSNNIIVCSAPRREVNSVLNAGKVFIYQKNGANWELTQKSVSPDASTQYCRFTDISGFDMVLAAYNPVANAIYFLNIQ